MAAVAGAAKTYRRGTHRAVTPAETLARLQPLRAAFGITRVANLTGLDRTGLPVVMVCRPNARSSAVFHGKGLDLAAAKASGLMEAIETWHAEQVELPLRLASLAELARGGGEACDVDGLPRVPGSRFHPDLRLLWVEGRDLVSGAPVWLPFETVHADATLLEAPGAGCFASDTNGLASGNTLAEATSHALCEVIERDATSLWHAGGPAGQEATRLDLDTIDDADCRAALDAVRRAGLSVAAWDITTDVGVPAVQCLVTDPGGEIGHPGHGAGCHPAREIAFLRALTEAVQVRTTYILGAREDIAHEDYDPAVLDARNRQAQALMRPAVRPRDFRSLGRFLFEDFETEVAWILDRLRAAALRQAVVVDLTRPALDVAVVRVVVPGLEGSDHHAGYVPGRRARAVRRGRP
ncbi:MAG: YcaO-like family protein [Rhodospirillaceae bacterium]|nr:YcaO-like family protein [Rhodospirillaceae bacterium]